MIQSKTVFIVGAGASAEVGLPVGGKLRNTIAEKLDIRYGDFGRPQKGSGDPHIREYLERNFRNDINRYLQACWRIRDGIGLNASIDDFIDNHRDDPDVATCGKIAIARSILEAERSSHLFFERPDTIDFNRIAGTWYQSFIELVTQSVPKAEVGSIFQNLAIVCFNYDRCIEHFLVHALAASYAISVEEAMAIVSGLKIFHPYGVVGQYFAGKGKVVPFGSTQLSKPEEILADLRTYTEEVRDVDELEAMRNAVAEAQVAVFLGMAFHRNNMKLLAGGLGHPEFKRVYATRDGISDEDLLIVRGSIAGLFKGQSNPAFSGKCADLFGTFRMHLRS